MLLDRPIKILKPTNTKNTHGEEVVSFSLDRNTWANVNYKGGREGFYARQVVATGDVTFTIRYTTTTLLETYRIEFDKKLYKIEHIAEVGRRDYHQITAKRFDNELAS